jgi:manganese-dependent inorganic pyrophosphatase
MERYVFPYINPDTDGVCSSLAYSYMKRITLGEVYVPVVFGNLNSETLFVLKYFTVETPRHVAQLPPDSVIVILDTHHRSELPPGIPFANVIEVIDHHPAGDPDLFPNARFENELVGAVATLITEKIRLNHVYPNHEIAGVLAAAIVSNTLDFKAPSTTARDEEAFCWLNQYAGIDSSFTTAMFEARSAMLNKVTSEVIRTDYKQFAISSAVIGISQLETNRPENLLRRPDLPDCLLNLKKEKNLSHVLLNIVDLARQRSTIVAVEEHTRNLLQCALEAQFAGITAEFPRILLRKTDLIPALKKVLHG